MSSKLKHTEEQNGGSSNESYPEPDWETPPPYEVHSSGDVLASSATVNEQGCLDIEFASTKPEELDRLLPQIPPPHSPYTVAPTGPCPPLNVNIQVVGSRGDVQPFIALGTALQRAGHRVRLATHDNFADFVRSSGLEFYPIGGDPEDLMSYMVKNPGLIPSMESLRGGDISRKRKMIYEMLRGCWKSCVEPDTVSGKPFVADAIIANPPSFAHVHCAQALGVPLHMMFTMPWTATRAFPHPLANVKAKNMNPKSSNYLSYGVVDLMTWQGLGDVINSWRVSDLQLEPLPAAVGPEIIELMQAPYTYCWSPALVPKPSDWGPKIDICGFFMRDEPLYNPPQDLADFLANGPRPVYVGFGSIVLDNAAEMTALIKEACSRSGVRVIISRGWSKLGGDEPNTESVFYLGDCPHEWLFKRVTAVVHHGGAGTTACGLVNGLPTTIVPFFGDQPFWGGVIASNRAGPKPIRYKELSVDRLTDAIQYCLSPEARNAAQAIAAQMKQEDGIGRAVESFHRHLPLEDMRCDILPENVARWRYCQKGKKSQNTEAKLSNAALGPLLQAKKLKMSDVKAARPKEYHVENRRWDPVTAGASSVLGTITDFTSALGGTFIDPFKEVKRVRRGGSDHTAAGSAAAVAAGRGLLGMTTSLVKGAIVDVPLALTEGFNAAPRLYGDTVTDHGQVTDLKSGGKVAAKNFGFGFYEAVTGVVTKPMDGAKSEGTIGFIKGVGKGSMGLVTKSGSAMFGLIAYPAQGAYKSVQAMGRDGVERAVLRGRMALLHVNPGDQRTSVGGNTEVLAKFEQLRRSYA